jgi:hypothetical protein
MRAEILEQVVAKPSADIRSTDQCVRIAHQKKIDVLKDRFFVRHHPKIVGGWVLCKVAADVSDFV